MTDPSIYRVHDLAKFERSTVNKRWASASNLNQNPSQVTQGTRVKFEITDQNIFVCDAMAELEISFHLTTAGGTALNAGEAIALDNNGFIFKDQTYLINGHPVEGPISYGNLCAGVNRLITWDKTYAESTGGNYFFYPDTTTSADGTEFTLNPVGWQTGATSTIGVTGGTSGYIPGDAFVISRNDDYNEGFAKRMAKSSAGNVYTYRIPLCDMFPFLRAYRKVMKGYRRTIEFTVDSFAQLISSSSTVTTGAKIVFDNLLIWYPVFEPDLEYASYLATELAENTDTEIEWETFNCYVQETSSNTPTLNFTNLAEQPTKILIGLQPLSIVDTQRALSSTFRHLSLTNCRLQFGARNYPDQGDFQCSFNTATENTTALWNEMVEVTGLRDAVATGTVLTKDLWKNVYPLIPFDLKDIPENVFVGAAPGVTFKANLTAGGSPYRALCFIWSIRKARLNTNDQKILVQ